MRARARWGITPLLAAPAGAWALGLGDIELQSALNQPLRAEIALSATADELQGLKVMLAAPDMFARRGIDRPDFLNNLEFRVVTDRSGRSVVHVSSQQSIVEPFVTLLVEATWPRGRNIKEYTVLLDPPVFLPAPAAPPAVQPAETRTSGSNAPGGQINRPAAPAAPPPERAPAPAPAVREPAAESPVSRATPPAPRAPAAATGGSYGPVQRAETLWAIADRLRPDGVTINQMMIAIYQANPAAFGGNINVLRAGVTLRLPDAADFDTLAVTVANAEVQRQTDEWQNRAPGGQLRLLPPTEAANAREPAPAPAPAPAPRATEPPPAAANAGASDAAVAAGVEESRRLLEIRNSQLQSVQQAAAATDAEVPPPAESESAEPGVEVESEQLFADETEAAPEPAVEEQAAPPAPAPVVQAPVDSEPSLVSRAVGWLASPLLWIGIGVAFLLLTALWFVRRRRQETEDVTGRWEALESETDDDETRIATERMRRQAPEETIVVEEQHAQSIRPAPEPEAPPRRAAAARSQPQRSAVQADETLSSQTVINLDQADAVAEADFHIAYGLYDQAAELVQKALEAAPDRRDLKLKLLEVYFMWGNKDAFLKAAEALRADIGPGDDADWNKVVIMGRQICPDERLFTEATTGAGRVDVDLEAGDSPLDLAFDEAATADVSAAASSGLDFDLETSDQRPAPKPAAAKPAVRDFGGDALDIGARTAAGLEAALFEDLAKDDDDGGRTTPDVAADSLAVTQESPTIERPGSSDWLTVESPTAEYAAEAPTVETPTIESPAAKSAQTMASKTVAIPRRNEAPTVEQPALGASTSEFTAEIDLDDLGLDVKDIEGLPTDLGDLPMASSHETDTREQPALRDDDALLSATGVTKVLHGGDDDSDAETGKTAVLSDQDATMMAPGFDEGTSTLTGTEVLEGRLEDDESGNTSLVKSLRGKDAGSVDLDLADLTAALHGADTVEQPRSSSFSRDVFGGGDTPLDLDIGSDSGGGDDDPTGTEEVGLDPQTMTEVGTKLDLARAYIDMGDPEGARSILEEVLDEGDSNQRREAQGLIDVLSA
jgi:pilus assembly protein FimV